MPVPPFSLTAPRYDPSTLWGRAKQMSEVTDFRSLFFTAQDLSEAQQLLASFKSKNLPPNTTDEKLWEARRIIDAMTRPGSAEVIPAPLRFSAFAPINIPICVMLMRSNPSTAYMMAAQTINQGYNSSVNYANRSSDDALDTTSLLGSFAGAVATGCGISYVMSRFSSSNRLLAFSIPFVSVTAASSASCGLMRANEWSKGVDVKDGDGEIRGKSVVAGRSGLLQCFAARALWTFPLLVIPPLIMTQLERTLPVLRKNALANKSCQALVIGLSLWQALPFALAVYPQNASISADLLEPMFQELVNKEGQRVTTFTYNKGL